MSWMPRLAFGQPDLPPTPLAQTAADLIGWLSGNPCTQQPFPECHDFQVQWNLANPNNPLVEDGKYGPLTRGALQFVMSTLGQGTAPPDCFTPSVAPPVVPVIPPAPPVVPPVVPPAPTPTPPTPTPTVPTNPPPSNMIPFALIGAGVATAGVFGYLYWKKNRRRG